jgi:hypothetical protein
MKLAMPTVVLHQTKPQLKWAVYKNSKLELNIVLTQVVMVDTNPVLITIIF